MSKYSPEDLVSLLLFISQTWTTRRSGWEDRGSRIAQTTGEHSLQQTLIPLLEWAMFGGSSAAAIRKAIVGALHDSDEVGLARDDTPYSPNSLKRYRKGRANFFETQPWQAASEQDEIKVYEKKREELVLKMISFGVTPRAQKFLLKYWERYNDPSRARGSGKKLVFDHTLGDGVQAVNEPTEFSTKGFVDEVSRRAKNSRQRRLAKAVENAYNQAHH